MALLHVHQLYLGNVTTINPAQTVCYTVPAGDRVVLRSIAVRNLNGAVGQTEYVFINGITVHTVLLASGGSSGGSDEWRPWIVLNPADQIKMACSIAAGLGVIISGSLYTI